MRLHRSDDTGPVGCLACLMVRGRRELHRRILGDRVSVVMLFFLRAAIIMVPFILCFRVEDFVAPSA